MMGCERIEELLPPYLDGEASGDERRTVEEHLAECATCRAMLRSLRRVDLGVAAWPDLPPEMRPHLVTIDDAIQRQIRRERLIVPMLWLVRRTASLAVSAAVVLVVLGLGFALLLMGSPMRQAGQKLSSASARVAAPWFGHLFATAASPTPPPDQVGLHRQQLANVVQISVLDYAKRSNRTVKDAATLEPVLDALAGARFVRHDPALANRVRQQTYIVLLDSKDGSRFSLIYLPSGQGPNVEDPGYENWWNAPGLDTAMQRLLPNPPVVAVGSGPIVEDKVLAASFGWPYGWLPIGNYLDRWPRFSPDGSKVAYLPLADGRKSPATRIVVRDLASGKEHDITPENGFTYTSVRWSPDGKSLAFVKYRFPRGNQGSPSQVWRSDADGSDSKLLYQEGPCSSGGPGPALSVAGWSADGKNLNVGGTVFQCLDAHVETVRADGSRFATPRTSPAASACPPEQLADWSGVPAVTDDYALCVVKAATHSTPSSVAAPTGTAIVRNDFGSPGSSSVLATLPSAERVVGVSASPDGHWIAIWTVPTGSLGTTSEEDHLWVVRRDGTGLHQVSGAAFHLVQHGDLRWADGGRAYFKALPGNALNQDAGYLYELDASAGTDQLVTTDWKIENLVGVSSDGRHLLVLRGSLPDTELHLLTVAADSASGGPAPATTGPVVVATATEAPTTSTSPLTISQLPAPVVSMAAVPGQPRTLYALLVTNALYRSDDAGQTWRRLPLPATESPYAAAASGEQRPETVVIPSRDVAVPAAKPDRVFVVANRVLYRSDDGGSTWTALNDAVYAWAVADGNGDVLYAWHGTVASEPGGLYRSADAGKTWQQVYGDVFPPVLSSQRCPCNHEGVSALLADPRNPNTLYAGTDFGIFRSVDGGKDWEELKAGLPPSTTLYRWTPILAAAPDGTVYALTDVSADYTTGAAALIRLRPGGVSWTVVGRSALARWQSPDAPFYGFSALAADPATPGRVYLGSAHGLLSSDDGGVTWRAVNVPSVHAVFGLTVAPSVGSVPTTLYLWTDAGFVAWTNQRE